MERLNYHHLLYFYTVAQEGSVARASLRLHLKQPTVSAQIHTLEKQLGRKLLERSGRGLTVTPAGETVLRYAESIFALGGELLSAVDGRGLDSPKLGVGVSPSLPQALVAPLLQAVFGLKPRPILTLMEGTTETLAAQLASRALQFVLTDAPPVGHAGLHRQVLLESVVEVFAPARLGRKLRKEFPASLVDLPFLMPPGGALRREVESWFASRKLRLEKLAEAPHPEMYAASANAAIFAPSLMRASLKRSQGLLPVGELGGLRWRMFLLAATRGTRHPGLDAVIGAAKVLR